LKETPPSADAAVLIRAVYPDKAKFLRSNHGPDFKEGEQAAFANKVIQLCYGDENAEQSKDHPKPPGAPRKRRSLLENSRS
jgi:hypothetical protein